MKRFHNLRDAGGFALTLQHNNSFAMARERVQTAAASRQASAMPFLISSRQLLEIESTCSMQRRKYFLISSFSGLFAIWRAGSEQLVLAAVVGQRDVLLEAQA
jgi:hypothetical protein